MPVKKKTNKKKPRPNPSQPRRDLADAEESHPNIWSHQNREQPAWNDQSVPPLRFSPYAWSKLLFLRDLGETEVGGFGISSPDDLFVIEDFLLVEQTCTFATVEFDDESVADFFDEQVDLGREPEQFARCWIHTHPGDSAEPSGTDEKTFARVFGNAHWAVMMILARGGQSYARLKFGCGPGAEVLVPLEIAWEAPFAASDPAAWEQEYERSVHALDQKRRGLKEMAFLEENPELLSDWGFPAWVDEDPSERSFVHHDETDEPIPL